MTPRCLDQFNYSQVPTEWNEVANFVFQLSCKSCGKGAFALDEISSGDAVTGVALVCEACGHEATLFDGKQHGYDGELGHNEHLEGDERREKILWHDGTPKRHDRVFVQFIYNTENAELNQIAEEESKAPADLFDWINVIEDNPGGETMWEYECA